MGLSKLTKLYIQLTLTVILFFAELVVGYYVKSIALVADAFHMLNDVVSLAIAAYAVKLAKDTRYNPRYSYGLQRAEVVGALINAVLLLGLCLTIVIEAIPRFFEPVEIEQPELVLIVGGIGLLFNVIGVFLFGHNHSHGHSHGHSHDHSLGQSNEKSHTVDLEKSVQKSTDEAPKNSEKQTIKHEHSHEGALNMRGVYLHVLGDALASVAVIVSALIIWLATFPERFLFDPIISIVITILIVRFTIPLIKSASQILLQGVPSSIPLDKVRKLLCDISGVVSIHEFHVWQLSDTKKVASVHIVLDNQHYPHFATIAVAIQNIMHSYDVHSITIQPECHVQNSQLSLPGSTPSLPPSDSNPMSATIVPLNSTTFLPCQLPCSDSCSSHQCCPTYIQ